MKYISTRDSSIVVSFEEALCHGYASDGGLFVPESLPTISKEGLEEWSSLGYVELSFEILRRFISADEITDEELMEVCQTAFVGFEDPANAVPVVQLGEMCISELFHGPTFCFKDMGLRALVGLLSHFASKSNKSITLLVSTTGDTGPAAVQAVADVANPLLTMLVSYPDGQISELQRRQLTTVDSKCVRVVAFEGGGDDMDAPIKSILTSENKDNLSERCSGVNSYNIGRPLMQMVHYIWTYLRVVKLKGLSFGDEIDIILPTGAMGNIAGGYIAKRMGLPVRKLCSGCNINDITDRVMRTGKFHKSDAMLRTLSEAINIQLPYNFERLLFYLTDCNHQLLKKWMTTVEATAKLDLDDNWLSLLQRDFDSARVTDDEMCSTMHKVKEKYGYYADPHTAVAITAAEMMGYPLEGPLERPAALLATASPCKFEEGVTIALSEDGWAEYKKKQFPAKAEILMEKAETPPILFKAEEGKSLKENQSVWEEQARVIVAELAKMT